MESVEKSKSISPVYTLAVLAIGVFMAQLDVTIFVPALNSVVSEYKTTFEWVIWTVTIYMLAFTVTMPLAGKISDLYGRKRLYIFGVGLFSIGSLACGLAWDINSLLFFRIIQAIGGGMIFPSALAEIGSSISKEKRGMALGIMMAVNAVAAIIGPNLGGFLVENLGWRYVFYINPPIGILAILLALKFPETYGTEKHKIDIVGAILLAGGLLSFMLGIVRIEKLPLSDVTVYPFFIAAAALAILLVMYEKRTVEPILNIPLLSRGDLLAVNLAALTFGFCFFSVVLYIPSFAQLILGLGIQDSGTILTPLTLSVLVMAVLGGKLMDMYGIKPIILLGAAIMCISLFGLVYFSTSSLILATILLVMGIGVGFCMGSFQNLMMSLVPDSYKGSASGIVNVFMNIGGIIGPTIGSYYLSRGSKKIEELKASMMPGTGGDTPMTMPPSGTGMDQMMLNLVKDCMGEAFSDIFMLTAAVSVLTIILLAYLVIRGRRAVSGDTAGELMEN
ncbi:MFS transporter [Methanooceanicella nereidis]|nr:MFS transporter [Methanocella sp. CWC-04]